MQSNQTNKIILGRGNRHSDLKMARGTPTPKMHPHRHTLNFGIPTSNDIGYTEDAIILEMRSEVKLKVTMD